MEGGDDVGRFKRNGRKPKTRTPGTKTLACRVCASDPRGRSQITLRSKRSQEDKNENVSVLPEARGGKREGKEPMAIRSRGTRTEAKDGARKKTIAEWPDFRLCLLEIMCKERTGNEGIEVWGKANVARKVGTGFGRKISL